MNYVLVDLFNHILFLEEKVLKERGIPLSLNEIHVLEAIRKCDSKTMSDIAASLRITPGTLSVSTKKLEKKGYISKVRDDKDKRIIRVELTHNADLVLNIHDAYHTEMVKSFSNDLSTEELEVLAKSLAKIADFFENGKERSLGK